MSSGERSVRARPDGNPEDSTLWEIQVRHGAYLPHWTQEGATYFVTFRLHDSLPASVVERWAAERRETLENAKQSGRPLSPAAKKRLDELHSERVEAYLNAGHGACWLRGPEIARGSGRRPSLRRSALRDACLVRDAQPRPCRRTSAAGVPAQRHTPFLEVVHSASREQAAGANRAVLAEGITRPLGPRRGGPGPLR